MFTVTSKKSGKSYILHKRVASNGATMFFFAGEQKEGALESLPEGMEVFENERTGLPMVRRKR